MLDDKRMYKFSRYPNFYAFSGFRNLRGDSPCPKGRSRIPVRRKDRSIAHYLVAFPLFHCPF